MKVLVTGANGQLGRCLQDAAINWPDTEFLFASKEDLDLTNLNDIRSYFESNSIDHCINTAAYTNVEKAESDKDNAFLVNAEAVQNLSKICQEFNTVLWHISTDYVFDGTKGSPYVETDKTNPLNVYGASKLEGERRIASTMDRFYIIRTSWLYSQYGHNFYNSILRFSKERDQLTITTEQTGTPTNANDLAKAILSLMHTSQPMYGIYHFSNDGKGTWYDFAVAIIKAHGLDNRVKVDKTDYYPTFAKRPVYSVMNIEKVTDALGYSIPNWAESLQKLVQETVS